MEAIVLPDTYSPNTNNSGDLVDSVNSIDWNIKKSVYCPCCTRVGQTYTRETLKKHFDSKRHKDWLADQNQNKTNFFKRNAELEDEVKNLRRMLASRDDTIACLTKQLKQLIKEKDVATADLLD